jgi:hypothetical protein
MDKKETQSSSEGYQYIPLDDPSLVWTTYDMGSATALLCAGFELLSLDKQNPRKALFIFKKEDGIEEIVDLYWSNRLEVKARTFFDTVKMLKNRLYSA